MAISVVKLFYFKIDGNRVCAAKRHHNGKHETKEAEIVSYYLNISSALPKETIHT